MRNDQFVDAGKLIVIWRWLSRSDDAATGDSEMGNKPLKAGYNQTSLIDKFDRLRQENQQLKASHAELIQELRRRRATRLQLRLQEVVNG